MAGASLSRPGGPPVTLSSRPAIARTAMSQVISAGQVTLRLHGELDLTRAAATAAAVQASAPAGQTVIIDLTSLTYLDCAALGSLARTRAAIRQAGGDILLAAPQPLVQRLLALTAPAGGFTICASVAAAQQLAATRRTCSPAGHQHTSLAVQAQS